MDLIDITKQVCDIARETGELIKAATLNKDEIEEKSDNNFVTQVDKASEINLVNALEKLIPGSGFIGEEDTLGNHLEDYTWIIDPLDGTTNFIHGVPLYCISIGLMKDDSIICGVIYEIPSGDCFYAWRGGGAYLNGERIFVSNTTTIKASLMATGFPYYDYGRLVEYLQLFKFMMQHTHGVRRLGSAAADLAWVACGRFDGFYEYGLSPWDVAAGIIIIKEAGGRVSDFKGGEDYLFGKEILVSNKEIFLELQSVIKQFFN
jgi:myo-inositol-1(or 4)-monophosphatase